MSDSNHAQQAIQTTTSVSEGRGRYGNVEPQIYVSFPRHTGHRVVRATLLRLAADVELATPQGAQWVVQIESYYAAGRVYLELVQSTRDEVARGMAVLQRVIG